MKKLAVIFLIFVLIACSGSKKLSNQNLAYRYSPGLNFIFPDYKVYNITSDSCMVYFEVDATQLLFVNNDSLNSFASSFAVSWKLYRNFDSKVELGSGINYFESKQNEGNSETVRNNFPIYAPDSSDYLLALTFSDLNRQQAVTNFYNIDRTGKQASENFILADADWNSAIIKNYTDKQINVKLFKQSNNHQKIYMRYFKNNYPLSSPPFSSSELKPLSYGANHTVVIDPDSIETINIDKPGIYHFQYDTLVKEGYTFFYFDKDFPLLTSAEGLIESIRFLTTRQEFDKILSSSDRKQAVDNFWLNMAGNRERGRILIKSYYSRVQLANTFFTSYTEGWKTDRGLIYIIFGPPASVYRNTNSEVWSYSQNSYYGSLSFTFDKISNPFTNNDFNLRRSAYYEIPWYKAVDSWRDGRVVNENY